MLTPLHKNARTTPDVRAEIAASSESASVLAQRYGITVQTVYKWRKRQNFSDRPNVANRLRTVLTPAQEAVVVQLRRALLLSLDDLLTVTREFLCAEVSRSGLDRCLRRHGVSNLEALRSVQAHAMADAELPGCLRLQVYGLPRLEQRSVGPGYLFVAIDHATRWVFAMLQADCNGVSARSFVWILQQAFPARIRQLLTPAGPGFTDPAFAWLCQGLGVAHVLLAPDADAVVGLAKCCDGYLADVLKTRCFRDGEDLRQALQRYVALYNHQLPQLALKGKTPIQAMDNCRVTHPWLFARACSPAA